MAAPPPPAPPETRRFPQRDKSSPPILTPCPVPVFSRSSWPFSQIKHFRDFFPSLTKDLIYEKSGFIFSTL